MNRSTRIATTKSELRKNSIKASLKFSLAILYLGSLAFGRIAFASDVYIYGINGSETNPLVAPFVGANPTPFQACMKWVSQPIDPANQCRYRQYTSNTYGSCNYDFRITLEPCPSPLNPFPDTQTITRTAVAPIDAKTPGKPPQCVGNPCNPATGNKFQTEVDFSGYGPFPLSFARYYNSMGSLFSASLGTRWSHNYDSRILVNLDGTVSVFRPDRKAYGYALQSGQWVSDSDVKDILQQLFNAGQPAGWTLTTVDGDFIETYDVSGKLVSIANRAGITQVLTYDTSGNLLSVTDPFGRSLTFNYQTADNLLHSVSTPDGGAITFAYDDLTSTVGLERLASVTYQDGSTRHYLYNESGFAPNTNRQLLTGIVDENNNRFATFTYSTNLQLTSSYHGTGADAVSLSYSSGSTSVTDALNTSRTYAFQSIQSVLRQTTVSGPVCPSCGPASVTYDTNGNPASQTDWNGNPTTYAYDTTRNLETSRTEASGTTVARTITTSWNANYRLPTVITVYAGGTATGTPVSTTNFSYDSLGNLTQKSITVPFGTGTRSRTWVYTYNSNGSVLTIDGPRTDVSDFTTYTYYANNDSDHGRAGNVATITNALSQTISIAAYNANGQPLTIVDPNGLNIALVYDARQRLISRTVGGTEVTAYTYDAAGQLTRITLPDGSYLQYTYDSAHRLTQISDNLGNKISYTLDAMGNRTLEQIRDPSNTLVQTRSRVYSSLNRLYQDIGAQNQITQYTYDNQGNVTSITDPLNRITSNQYDALNRLIQVTDPNQGQTQYGYDGIDQLISVTDPRSLVTGYTVDGLGNLTQVQSPDTGATANTYDAAGNLITQTDAKGQVTTYAYDALNRVTLITLNDGSTQTYAYDQGTYGIGRLTQITETDPALQVVNKIDYSYDQHGRVVAEARHVNGVAYTANYRYDSQGRLVGMTYPSGRGIAYTFDGLGRLSRIDGAAPAAQGGQTQPLARDIQYQPFSGVLSYTLGNGQAVVRSYDQDGRIASYTLGASTYSVGFDAASRITGISEVGNPGNTNTYGYDTLDRLTSAVLPTSTLGYSYDAVGNRLTRSVGANTDNYTYSSTSNRIATLTPASGPSRTFSLDANGSTTNDGVNQFAYDNRGRMVQATTALGVTTYQVNALGQRSRKTTGSDDRVFLYDLRGHLISEATASGALLREYLYLGDIPIGVLQ